MHEVHLKAESREKVSGRTVHVTTQVVVGPA